MKQEIVLLPDDTTKILNLMALYALLKILNQLESRMQKVENYEVHSLIHPKPSFMIWKVSEEPYYLCIP